MAIEIVDLPYKKGDFLQFFVSLPEGSGDLRMISVGFSIDSLTVSQVWESSPSPLFRPLGDVDVSTEKYHTAASRMRNGRPKQNTPEKPLINDDP